MNPLEVTFRFARPYSPFVLAALCAVVIVAGFWSLRHEAPFASRRLRATLALLRVLPFLLLVFLLLKPVLVYRTESTIKQRVALLVDESESMRIADKVLSRVQLESAAHLLTLRPDRAVWPPKRDADALPSPRAEQGHQQALGLSDAAVEKIKATDRATLVRRALLLEDGALLRRLRDDYLFNIYAFSQTLREIPFGAQDAPQRAVDALATTGPVTRVGTALQRLVQDLRGQPVAGIVLISDGRNVGGIAPESAADVAGDARIPIFAVPVGSGGSRDIAVNALIAEAVVFKGDEFPVSAKLASRGYAGLSVPLALDVDGREVESRPVALTGQEQIVTFRHKRDAEGPIQVRIRVRPREGEETADNNMAETTIRVIDKKIKVLMAEEIPRWDFRYLTTALQRDPHVELKLFLQQADREVIDTDPLYLPALPSTEAELFEYDLLVLGGLRPRFLRDEQMTLIERFVSKMGGGVIFLGVENISPDLFAGTPLEPLLPVRLIRDTRRWLDPDRLNASTLERRLALTPEGLNHSLAALELETDRNRRLWEAFPPHFWVAEVGGLKPAAQALVESVGSRNAPTMPAIAVQPYGLGRVLYVGIDSSWRWRYKVGDQLFNRFWGQAVQFLTMSRLLGQNRRLQIVADRENYEAGETASFSIRALDASFQPRRAAEIDLVIEDQTGKRHDVRGYQEPDREGLYSAVFRIPYEGRFRATVEDAGETAQLEFAAKRARLELRDPEADWATMAQIAQRSGGRVVTLDWLDELPKLLGRSETRFIDRREQALWDWPAFLALFLLVKTIELALRKFRHLK